jgi:hypothetical protein
VTDSLIIDDLISDLQECKPHDVLYAGDLLQRLLRRRQANLSPEVPSTEAWPGRELDPEYLDRLEAGIHPESGDMVVRRWTYEDGDDAGKVAIWQVQVRGDDVLALIRTARSSMQQSEQARQPSDVGS